MRSSTKARGSVLLLAACLSVVAGCSSTGAPKGWLPIAADVAVEPYGAWIRAEPFDNVAPPLVGEFIAVAEDSLLVLTYRGLESSPLDEVKAAKIAFFDPELYRASGWVATGSVLTVSHGWGLILSLPMWLIFGSASAGSHSRTPLATYPDQSWQELRMYARFPQGPPPGLRELDLQGKSRLGPPRILDPIPQDRGL